MMQLQQGFAIREMGFAKSVGTAAILSCSTSALGQKQTSHLKSRCPLYPRKRIFGSAKIVMSALCHKRTSSQLFDYFIGKLLELVRHVEAQRLGGRQINDEFVFCWGLYRQIDRLLTLKNAIGICRSRFKLVHALTSVGKRAALFREEAQG